MRGRDYALPQDVRDLALDVLRHRLVLSYEALADNVTADAILDRVLAAVPLPEVPLRERRARLRRRPSSVQTPERVLRRLEWRVIRRLDGRLQGDYRTMFRGVGIDFADLREYEPGDDVRHIDWNVTARMDTPFVRTFLEDRELTAWLLLDRSPSMGFGPTDRPKELVLIELADDARPAAHAGRQPRRRDPLQQRGRGDDPAAQRPQPGAAPHPRPAPAGRADRHGHRPRPTCSSTAPRAIRRRSLVVLISDFISEPGWERPLPS